jgi:SAM-dependent methyltransferase
MKRMPPTSRKPKTAAKADGPKLVPPPSTGLEQPVHPFDLAYGTDTSGLIPSRDLLTGHPNDAHITAYYGVAPSILDALIELWQRQSPAFELDRYTFLDFGAGKGRAMLAAALHPFQRVVGIELNPMLADIAQANLERFTKSAPVLAPIRLLQQDALEFDLPATPTVAFLFHPFEAPVLRRLLRRIEHAFHDRPGQLDLLYVNAECAAVLDHHPAFTRLFFGKVAMSTEDHIADLAEIAAQKEYGSTGDEECAIYRFTGRRAVRE